MITRLRVPAFIRPSTLSNSNLRSSVTISAVSLSLIWKVELIGRVEGIVVNDGAASLERSRSSR